LDYPARREENSELAAAEILAVARQWYVAGEKWGQDVASLRSQIVTLKTGRGAHRKYPMLAFTEHGAIMAATILNCDRAVEMSVYVVRAFVKSRELLASNTELARELTALKKSVATLDADTRRQFDLVYEAILGLTSPTTKKQ
jgi:hypothetical protein